MCVFLVEVDGGSAYYCVFFFIFLLSGLGSHCIHNVVNKLNRVFFNRSSESMNRNWRVNKTHAAVLLSTGFATVKNIISDILQKKMKIQF